MSYSYSTSNRVGRSANRAVYDSGSRSQGGSGSATRYRSKSLDDTYKRSGSNHRSYTGTSNIGDAYRSSYTTGGYKTYTLDGDRYGKSDSHYISKGATDGADSRYKSTIGDTASSKYLSKHDGADISTSGGAGVTSSSKYRISSSNIHSSGENVVGHSHSGAGGGHDRTIGHAGVETTAGRDFSVKETSKTSGLNVSADDSSESKSKYRIVGRIMKSPSPDRKPGGYSKPSTSGTGKVLSLPRPGVEVERGRTVARISSHGRHNSADYVLDRSRLYSYGGTAGGNGVGYSGRVGNGGRDGRYGGRGGGGGGDGGVGRGCSDIGGASGGGNFDGDRSGARWGDRGGPGASSHWRSPGRSPGHPQGRSSQHYPARILNPNDLPKPILKSYLNRNSSLRRSRSMNDVRSPSPGRSYTHDSLFPVCSRFPNCSVCSIDIPQNQSNRDQVIGTMQDELKDESDHIAIIEKKDKEIQLKTETIAQITQILEKTKKELQVRVVECNRRETEIKQLKVEMKNILNEKKKVEYSYSEQQITVSKLDATETRLGQMTVKCDELTSDNRELVERVKQLEISEREFIDLERNVIELQTQLRDMEDVEYHRDELMQKLNAVKRQRDEFLQKGKLVEEERNEFVKSNKTLEQYLIEWKRKTSEFKKTNQALKDRILSLERDKKELEDRVINIQQERTIMQTKISNLEMEREDYMRELREITLERNALEARLADYEDMLGDHDQLEEGFHSLRLKVAELTRQRDDLEIMIHSYKAKVQHLKRSVHERDEKILELSHEIKILKVSIDSDGYTHDVKVPSHRHHQNKKDRVKSFFVNGDENIEATKIYRPSDTDVTSDVDSYDMLPVRGVKYDTHTDESIVDDKYTRKRRAEQSKRRKYVALFDYDPYKSSASDHPERELRLKEGDYVTVYGEVDIDGYLEGEVDGISGLVPSVYVEELSDDDAQYASQRHHHHKSVTSSSNSTRYVVLYDYDPYTMGTTDRPDLQLSLRKGDVIIVYGSVNEEGYYTASLNGVRGLVPSNFVEEYSSYYASRHSQHHHHDNSDFHHFGNIEGTIEVEEIAGPPYAPRDLKVTRVVTSNAVLLSWQLPPMDEHYNSNGCRVVGYRLWINGKFKQDVKTATTTKVLLDDVDLRGRVEFSIQTIGEGDLCSEKCHFAITGALAAVADSNVKHGDNMYVALYDYDPFKSSPNPNPSLELAFREGDLMAVHDKTRSDGFYGAELNGRKGLVPSNFIERVSGKNVHQHHQHRSSQESEINRRVSFQPKKD